MPSPLHQRDPQPMHVITVCYVQTFYFDLQFKLISSRVDQTSIIPDAPNWESESCRLIPHIWYEYTRVTKKDPKTSRSAKTRIKDAQEKIMFLAAAGHTPRSVLRIVKEPIVIRLQPGNKKIIKNIPVYYLEDSYSCLSSDEIAAQRTTREMPPGVKKIAKAVTQKTDTASVRHKKK